MENPYYLVTRVMICEKGFQWSFVKSIDSCQLVQADIARNLLLISVFGFSAIFLHIYSF